MKISKTKFDIALARACTNATELSKKGIGRTTLNRATGSGKEGVSPKMVGKIARALGVDVTDLLESEDAHFASLNKDIIGYSGAGANFGIFVAADDALDFAMERCGVHVTNLDAPELEDFLEMFEEWFFSCGWVKEVAADDQRTA